MLLVGVCACPVHFVVLATDKQHNVPAQGRLYSHIR